MKELETFIKGQGIYLYNIIKPEKDKKTEQHYKDWIDKKCHGSMKYLEKNIHFKTDANHILPGCKTVIAAGLNYNTEKTVKTEKTHGRISAYAAGRDYHKVLGNKLKKISKWIDSRYPGIKSKSFTDAVPISENYFAVSAGLGFKGKNSLVINPNYGSWFFLGEILTTKEFLSIYNIDNNLLLKNSINCGNCDLCIKACPTGAIREGNSIDASKCISYLTIEYSGIIPLKLRSKMKNRIFGCDACQSVCPYNNKTEITKEPGFKKTITGTSLGLKKILEIKDHADFVKLFAGSPLMRAGRAKLIRNVCIAAANNRLYELLPVLTKLKADENKIISKHAEWAVEMLEG